MTGSYYIAARSEQDLVHPGQRRYKCLSNFHQRFWRCNCTDSFINAVFFCLEAFSVWYCWHWQSFMRWFQSTNSWSPCTVNTSSAGSSGSSRIGCFVSRLRTTSSCAPFSCSGRSTARERWPPGVKPCVMWGTWPPCTPSPKTTGEADWPGEMRASVSLLLLF